MIRLLALLAVMAWPASAETTDAARLAESAARALDEAAQSLRQAGSARERVAALTRSVKAYESGLAALREGLRRAAQDEAALSARMTAQRQQLSQLVGTLQTMGAAPEALFLLHPSGPVDTARAGMLVRDVTPAVLARVDALRADLSDLEASRALQLTARKDLAEGLQGLQQARTDLSRAVSDRMDLPPPVAADESTMMQLAQSVDTLFAFAARLPRGISQDLPDFATAAGALALPVSGTVTRRFDAPDAAGIRRPGWVIDTAPGALVTAPWPATLRYVGPLLDYGNVMILEPGAGYLLVMGGLGIVYGRSGDVVATGDPLGLMPGANISETDWTETSDSGDAGQTGRKALYVEVRMGNAPVDPATWFVDEQE